MSAFVQGSPGAVRELTFYGFDSGLVGTIGVTIYDGQGATTTARTTSGIIEISGRPGVYVATITLPTTAGQYQAVCDNGTSPLSENDVAAYDLEVTYSALVSGTPTGSDLTTVAAVKLADRKTSTTDDDLIQQAITAASAEIHRWTRREFAPATSSATRRVRVYPDRRLDGALLVSLSPYDLRTVTSASLHPETSSPVVLTENSDYVLHTVSPQDGTYTDLLVYQMSLSQSTLLNRFGFAFLDITGAWGFPSIPSDVEQACIDTVKSWLEREYASSGWAGQGSDGRTQLPGLPQGFSLPRRAIDRLRRYQRPGVA